MAFEQAIFYGFLEGKPWVKTPYCAPARLLSVQFPSTFPLRFRNGPCLSLAPPPKAHRGMAQASPAVGDCTWGASESDIGGGRWHRGRGKGSGRRKRRKKGGEITSTNPPANGKIHKSSSECVNQKRNKHARHTCNKTNTKTIQSGSNLTWT